MCYLSEGMSWWMIFGMTALWGAIIALTVWGISKLAGRGSPGSGAAGRYGALDIAKERYARGEIPKEEFEQIKKDLSWFGNKES
jgi:putative membrane protein